MIEFITADALTALLQVVLIDLVLAGDNAVVIGLAAAGLPAEQRRRAIVVGGVLSILPVLGIWMLPLGLALLAEDIPALRSSRSKVFDWIERRKPHWLDPSAPKNDQS